MKPYYEHAGITIYHADCREVLPELPDLPLLTDPPYPNNAGHFDNSVACAVGVLWAHQHDSMVFWSEIERPPATQPLVAVHVWHRTNVNGRPYEPIYHHEKAGQKRRSCVFRHAAIFDGAGPGCAEYLGHPTQKPRALIYALLEITKWDAFVDPFCGSGSALRAAKDLGRKAIGIEIEEKYCEIAARRLAQEVLF